jgi:hypothetical protein
MRRVVKSFNGDGRLLLRGGGALSGRYHVDLSYRPVRRIHAAEGNFVLDAAPGWDSVVEAEFAGNAGILLADGRQISVTLGGIVGKEVAIVGMEPLPED